MVRLLDKNSCKFLLFREYYPKTGSAYSDKNLKLALPDGKEKDVKIHFGQESSAMEILQRS